MAIFGGGMGGLACAHELVKLGFSVDVFEASSEVGGKAKSQYLRGTAAPGLSDLPGEHGFRFYPRFYRHTIASMSEIPDPLSPSGLASGNLIGTRESGIALGGDEGLLVGPRHPKDVLGFLAMFRRAGVTATDAWRYFAVHMKFLSACEERRLAEYEPMSWLEFIRADDPQTFSPRYREIVVSVTRTMVAMDAHRGSARTCATASSMLLLDPAYSAGDDLDRTMTGPTSEVWIEPWRQHLEHLGVRFHLRHALTDLHCDGRRITGATVRRLGDGSTHRIDADEYVAALPIETMHRLIGRSLADADPSLARLASADLSSLTAWMTGAQYFLRRDVPLCAGHVFFPSSPWALTAVSQAQFWNQGRRGMHRYGDGRLGGILSIDISGCFAPDERGRMLTSCRSQDEVLDSVWAQVLDGLGSAERRVLADNVFARHLDDEVSFDASGVRNTARLLVHPPGSHGLRPDAALAIDNLSLAADFVRTGVDLASMEGANEAGRRAARALAARAGLDPAAVQLFDYPVETVFEPARALDRVLFRAGLPHVMDGAGPWMNRVATRLLDTAVSVREAELVRRLLRDSPRESNHEQRRAPAAVNAQQTFLAGLSGPEGKPAVPPAPPM